MARVPLTPIAINFPIYRSSSFTCHIQPSRFLNFSSHSRNNSHQYHQIFCLNISDSNATKEKRSADTESGILVGGGLPELIQISRRSALAAIGFVLSQRWEFGGASLKDLSAATSMPYEEFAAQALSNDEPSVVEFHHFYADWRKVWRELPPDLYEGQHPSNACVS